MDTVEIKQELADNVSWDAIIGSIQQEKCIICIGPGVYAEGNISLEEQIARHLEAHKERLKIRIYDDSWIHYLPGHNVVEPHMKIKEFYNKIFPSAQRILNKLVQIPFHFFISTTPDRKLRESFTGYPYRFEFYYKNKSYNDTNLEKPTRTMPLVYNILGEIEHRESLVLSYDDFYSYLESIFSGLSMSPKIKESIHEADNFIFLGLPFDKWYMHLFLRILEQHKNKNQLKYAPTDYLPEQVQTYCNDQFNITFVPINVETFVDTLYEKCMLSDPPMIRQKAANSIEFPTGEIKQMIAGNQIEEAFELFFNVLSLHRLNCKKVYDDLATLSAQYKHLMERFRLTIINSENYNTERSQITYSLIKLVNDAEICAKTG